MPDLITVDTSVKFLDGMTPPLASQQGSEYRYPGRGRWTTHLDPARLRPCFVGYHYVQVGDLLSWLRHSDLWTVEPCPDHDPIWHTLGAPKAVTCRLRLVDKVDTYTPDTLRRWALDEAERALLTVEAAGGGTDERSWEAVRVVRSFLDGATTRDEATVAYYSAAACTRYDSVDAGGVAAYAAANAARGGGGDGDVYDTVAAAVAAVAAVAASASARAASASARATSASARAAQIDRLLRYLNVQPLPELSPYPTTQEPSP